MKRGRIQLGAIDPIMRITSPGYDVDTAPDYGFLLHENHLYSQPFFWQFAPCPFAGYTGRDYRDETIDVTFPSVGNEPIVAVYPVNSDGVMSFPCDRSLGTGSNPTIWAGLEGWRVTLTHLSLTQVRVRFTKSTSSGRSPNGAYLFMTRIANA